MSRANVTHIITFGVCCSEAVCSFKSQYNCMYFSEYIVECVFTVHSLTLCTHTVCLRVCQQICFIYNRLVLYSNLRRTTAVLCGNYFKGVENYDDHASHYLLSCSL